METKAPPYSLSKAKTEAISEQTDSGSIYPYLHILRKRKGLIVLSVSIALCIAFFINLTQKAVYSASAELILTPKDSKTLSSQPAGNSLMSDPTFLLTQERLIRGQRFAHRVLEKIEKPENREDLLACFGVRPSRKRKETTVFSEKERRALMGAIQGSVSTGQVERGARLISISTTGYVPQMVARVANAAAESYVEINYQTHMESFRQNFVMVSRSLAELRQKIKTGDTAFQMINSEIRLLEAEKVYGDKHPLVIQLRTDIPQLANKLRQNMKNLETLEISQRKDLFSLLLRPSTVTEDLQKIEEDLYTLKPILEQEVNNNREMYNSISRRLQEIEVTGGGSLWMDAEVVEPAGVPGRPIRPNKKMNLIMGLFAGLFFGISLAFFLEYLDSSMRSPDDVRSYLKLFPLGMVPQVQLVAPEGQPLDEKGTPVTNLRPFWLTSDSKVPLYVAEAYRIIRTNLSFGSVDSSLRALQVTSAVKGEGKTTTAANLAISLALAGTKTLLVDADLRRPALHRILELGGVEGGLSDALTNGKSAESLIVPTSIPNLFCLTAGSVPPNPAELLSSKRMKALIEELKEQYDTVIFDSPPVISVADSAIIASRVDGTIFVSRSGFIPRHLCLQAKHALESVNGKLIGCVLNSVQTEHQPYYYHQYSRDYGRYHDDQETSGSKSKLPANLTRRVEELKILKEPLLIFLSAGWARLADLLKWGQSKKESKPSVGAPQ